MSKTILLFDMDGVLLKPRGYHRALQDTVRLGARELGFEAHLTDDEIAEFEGAGISSEWHSGAACMSVLAMNGTLDLGPLFRLLKGEQAQIPARLRLERAIHKLAEESDVDPAQPVAFIRESETARSFTHRTFQEMILGSADLESYLLRYDEPLLDSSVRKKVLTWLEHPEHGGAVMTNRPSRGMPDADYGLQLVGLEGMPLAGYGEMEEMAAIFGGEAALYSKPAPTHALAAALGAVGVPNHLHLAQALANGSAPENLADLDDTDFWVFEDTPAGLVSAEEMGRVLRKSGLAVRVHKTGVTESPLKRAYLSEKGAQVFKNIEMALAQVI